ncbi:hypothetical protein BJY00DRAFT_323758 [Aspergillus carlsbadensis]|nr:hypothetical protein BJY00DRAFT_323758 [Aspergillus carlsbadensis]
MTTILDVFAEATVMETALMALVFILGLACVGFASQRRERAVAPPPSTVSAEQPSKNDADQTSSPYTIGWICALSTELVAAQEFLDEEHEGPDSVPLNDHTDYTLGKVKDHNVVIAVLPDSEYGTASAATVATNMGHAFPNIRIGLLVGIGGGVPSERHDIRLGDVVVSAPRNGHGGVFQYDFGKAMQGGRFLHTRFLNQPPTVLRSAISGIKALYKRKGHQLESKINEVLDRNPLIRDEYRRPRLDSDRLFRADAVHHPDGCAIVCTNDPCNVVKRPERKAHEQHPCIHYGTIASASQVMKDALIRDQLAAEHDVLCFEMEAAGLMNEFPCLVIRGICDYSDSHKNDQWHGYAAMTAAAFAKDILYQIAPDRVETEKKLSEILSDVSANVSRTEVQVKEMSSRLTREEDRAVMEWLSPIRHGDQQSDHFKRRQEGDGQWLLESPEFQHWLEAGETSQRTLFCPGIPGAGKTILTSIVIDYLERRSRTLPDVGIAYIYYNFKEQDIHEPLSLLRSLLKQLAGQQSCLNQTVKSLYSDHIIPDTTPTVEQVLSALQAVIAGFSTVYIVIDALDECQATHRRKLLSQLFDLQDRYSLNILATSRFIPDILEQLEQAKLLEIRISNAADGMFLLAQIYLTLLDDKTTTNAIRTSLEAFSKKQQESDDNDKTKVLRHAYDEAMERINGQKAGLKELATAVLSWISCAKRPLTTIELQHALATKVGKSALDPGDLHQVDDLVAVCLGLVTVDKGAKSIRLVHYTTQEYFEESWKRWFPEAHAYITRSCVSYLLFEEFGSGPAYGKNELMQRLQANALYEYASVYWGRHARACPFEGNGVVLELLASDAKLQSCCQVLLTTHPRRYIFAVRVRTESPRMTGAHVSAYFGLSISLIAILGERTHPDPIDVTGWTPLFWAAAKGHKSAVETLLDKNADLDLQSDGSTPLLEAVAEGHGAGLECMNHSNMTALSVAVQNGHEGIVKLLLSRGANAESKDDYGRRPMEIAIRGGHGSERLVRVLLDNGANIDSPESLRDRSPLLSAVFERNDAVVRLLLDRGADANISDRIGYTPMMIATLTKQPQLAKLLLESNAGVGFLDYRGRPVLSMAAQTGQDDIIRALLATNKMDLFQKDALGRGPLFFATRSGSETACAALLAYTRSELDQVDAYGSTPLSMAASGGHENLVKLFLSFREVELNHADIFGRTPLWWARAKGYTHISRLLIETAENRGIPISNITPPLDTPVAAGKSRARCNHTWCSLSDKGTCLGGKVYAS